MHQHFTKGHLDPTCYKSVARIEYIKYKTKSDAQVMETYYINKYKGIYNKQNKRNDELTVKLEEKEWKLYRELRPANKPIQLKNLWILKLGTLAMVIYTILRALNLI